MNSRCEAEIREMKEREARAVQAVLKIKAEVMPILAEDFARFPEREIRKRFVSNPAFARTLDEGAIREIKAAIARRSPEVKNRVIAMMEEDERWLAGVHFCGPGKSFTENERLWEPTRAMVELVREILEAYKFPDPENYPTEYKMPTWFIAGKYLPGLAEKYWACIADLREARERIRELEEAMTREDLGRRWDSVQTPDV